jgi:hypothetical protein
MRGLAALRTTTSLVGIVYHFMLIAGAGSVCIAVARFHMILSPRRLVADRPPVGQILRPSLARRVGARFPILYQRLPPCPNVGDACLIHLRKFPALSLKPPNVGAKNLTLPPSSATSWYLDLMKHCTFVVWVRHELFSLA